MEGAEMQPDEYLQGHHICPLATATKAGTPHASAFWYASEGLDLYLAVDERSTTAHNLSENPYVAGAIYADTADWRQGRSRPHTGRADAGHRGLRPEVPGDDDAGRSLGALVPRRRLRPARGGERGEAAGDLLRRQLP